MNKKDNKKQIKDRFILDVVKYVNDKQFKRN